MVFCVVPQLISSHTAAAATPHTSSATDIPANQPRTPEASVPCASHHSSCAHEFESTTTLSLRDYVQDSMPCVCSARRVLKVIV